MKKYFGPLVSILVLSGCAGTQRGCANWQATTFGADWVAVQYGFGKEPINCWVLKNVSVTNEDKSDGIHWLNSEGHMVHIAGWVDRVQVSNGNFKSAAAQIGVKDISVCSN